jgi:hypothetical protein
MKIVLFNKQKHTSLQKLEIWERSSYAPHKKNSPAFNADTKNMQGL